MSSRLLRVALLPLAFALGVPAAVRAQMETDCAGYAACSLRVQYGIFTSHIVRGSDDERLTRIGFTVPPLEDLFARSPQAAMHFQAFAQDHTRSSWTGLLGTLGFVGGMIAGAKGDEEWAAGLSVGGTIFSLTAGLFRTKANEHLSRAVWHYNASLVEADGR